MEEEEEENGGGGGGGAGALALSSARAGCSRSSRSTSMVAASRVERSGQAVGTCRGRRCQTEGGGGGHIAFVQCKVFCLTNCCCCCVPGIYSTWYEDTNVFLYQYVWIILSESLVAGKILLRIYRAVPGTYEDGPRHPQRGQLRVDVVGNEDTSTVSQRSTATLEQHSEPSSNERCTGHTAAVVLCCYNGCSAAARTLVK